MRIRDGRDAGWTDLETGEWSTIVSIAEIAAIPQERTGEGPHWFNHLLFNTDGTRFIFLVLSLVTCVHSVTPNLEDVGAGLSCFAVVSTKADVRRS